MTFTGTGTISGTQRLNGAPSEHEVHTVSQIDAMADVFNSLESGVVRQFSPIQDLTWTGTCAEKLADGSRLTVAHVRRGDQIVAIAPLCRDRGLFSAFEQLGVKQLLEPMDFIYCDREALDALAASLAQLRMPLFLYRLPANSLVPAALEHAYRGRGRIMSRDGGCYPYIELADFTVEKRLSSRMRHDIRRARRKADKSGNVSFEVLAPGGKDDFRPMFREFLAVEAANWKGRAGTALSCDALRRDFYEEYGIRASEAGILRMCFMRIDGKAVATQLAVEYGRRFWLLKIGFNEAYARCSPGTLLMHATLCYAIEQGLQSYEFLGTVDRWTKHWTQSERNSLIVAVCPYTPGGMLTLIGDISRYFWRKLMERSTRNLRKLYSGGA